MPTHYCCCDTCEWRSKAAAATRSSQMRHTTKARGDAWLADGDSSRGDLGDMARLAEAADRPLRRRTPPPPGTAMLRVEIAEEGDPGIMPPSAASSFAISAAALLVRTVSGRLGFRAVASANATRFRWGEDGCCSEAAAPGAGGRWWAPGNSSVGGGGARPSPGYDTDRSRCVRRQHESA